MNNSRISPRLASFFGFVIAAATLGCSGSATDPGLPVSGGATSGGLPVVGGQSSGGAASSNGGASVGNGGSTSPQQGGSGNGGASVGNGGSTSPQQGGSGNGGAQQGGAAVNGGSTETGGNAAGGTSTGGTTGLGGQATGGQSIGGAAQGGAATGGAATGGKAAGGTASGGVATGGKAAGGTASGGAAGSGCAAGTNSLLNSLLPKTMYWANATTEAATWLLSGTSATRVTTIMTAAGASKFAVFTTYYSVNVNPNATGFATWIDGIAKAIGAQPNPAVVVLEPDAFPAAGTGTTNQAKHDIMNAGIGTIKQNAPNAAVFLDIGHSGWLSAASVATKVKTYSNYALIDGWASNTSNFRPMPNEVTYAQQLWALTCKPTIIDTSRNGLGTMPSTIINPPASEWAVGASFAWWPTNPAVFFNYHNKPWNESD